VDAATVSRLLRGFGIDASPSVVEPLGQGRIHKTFRCATDDGVYLLQRVNTSVFRDPSALAQAGRQVQRHLLEARATGRYRFEVPANLEAVGDRIDPTLPGLLRDEDGSIWRAMDFIHDSRGLEVAETLDQAAEAGRAYGHFAAVMGTLSPDGFPVPLPGFHDPSRRFAELQQVAATGGSDRLAGLQDDLNYCAACRDEIEGFVQASRSWTPRICHNDTKIDNLLFDSRGERVVAVVDLDTTMPGFWAYDFGDLVRSVAASGDEDQDDGPTLHLRDDYVEAVAEGFIDGLGPLADGSTRAMLWAGVRLMPLMLGMRFLADHLAGDRYFPVEREAQNLQRARRQLALHRDGVRRESSLSRKILASGTR